MPLVSSPGEVGAVDSSPTTREARALADVRDALRLVAGDSRARQLLSETAAEPDPEGLLASWLYGRWWCGPAAPTDPTPPSQRAAALGGARLEAARRTSAPTSAGWLVLAAVGDVLVAARHDGRIRIDTHAVVASSRPGRPARPGDLVTLQHGSSSLDPSAAWWWAHAGRADDLADSALDRWYVHARGLASACAVVPLLLEVATEVDCPLSLKCPPVEQGYGRRDALVAYLPRDASRRAETALRQRARPLGVLLEPDVPPCTRRLLPGVAQAEDPGARDGEAARSDTGVSYGQLRCSQVAALAARLSGRSISDRSLTAALADLGMDTYAIEKVRR
ncbi:MAG TPA: T3SS effector HopA1 family protein [Microlunatus sp.]